MNFFTWITTIGIVLATTCSFVHARDVARDASDDVRFLSARIAQDHPGMVNPGDPAFRRRANEAARKALRRADKARTVGDYRDVLTAYVASFEDPHLSVELNDTQDAASPPPGAALTRRGGFEQLSSDIWLLRLPTFYAGEPGFDDVIHAIDQAEKELARNTPGTLVIDLRGNGGGASEPGDRVLMAIWGNHALPALAGRRAKSSAWRASRNVLRDLEQRRPRIAQRYPTELAGYDQLLSGLRGAVNHNQLLYQEPIVPTVDRGALKAGPKKVFVITDSACISACLDFMDRVLEAPHVVQVGQATGWDTIYTEVESISLPSGRGDATIPVQLLQGRYRASRQVYEPSIHLDDDKAIDGWIASLKPSTP
ncbi:S41 family peptidase [Dyella sp.]|uniref:S41 family peptidase n=1 Tax=Dyella sp. TaxID=1869338 RepID=UPI002ED34C73